MTAAAKTSGTPAWRIVQDALIQYLEIELPGEHGAAAAYGLDFGDHAELRAITREPEHQAMPATADADVRKLDLARSEVKALYEALHWWTLRDGAKESPEHAALADLHERASQQSEQLFRIGLDNARRRTGSMSDPWELPLEDCQRLRRVAKMYLDAGKERMEAEIKLYFYGKDPMPEPDQKLHRRRIRREARCANGKLRALLKRIPWR